MIGFGTGVGFHCVFEISKDMFLKTEAIAGISPFDDSLTTEELEDEVKTALKDFDELDA